MNFLVSLTRILMISSCLLPNLRAETNEPGNIQLYIGIENNRFPYAFIGKRQQPQGLLVQRIKQLCKQIGANCDFVNGGFDPLMEDLQTFQLHGLLVVDSFLMPEIDRLTLTPPICHLRPVVIQKQTANPPRTQPEDFEQSTLGVLQGSLLHLYMLDEYSSNALLKPYLILESAIVDLVTGRIDALFADEAFFEARIANTVLGKADNEERLVAPRLADIELPPTSMSLAVRENDAELLAALTEAINSTKTLSCRCLLDDLELDDVMPEPPQPVTQN